MGAWDDDTSFRPASRRTSRYGRRGCTARAAVDCADPTGHFFSHETAASIWGAPLPLAFDDRGSVATADDLALHVSASGGIPIPRARGVTGHRTLSSLTSIRYRDGLRVTSPAATWVSLGTLPLADLVALGDYFCRRWRPGVGRPDVARQPWATIDELREMLAASGPDLEPIARLEGELESTRRRDPGAVAPRPHPDAAHPEDRTMSASAPVSEPVTVSIRREVDPERIAEATAWVQTGVNLATKYPGFLGSGWVRAGEDSQVWHMLYRFASEDALTAWEQSGERAWWLSMGQGFVRSERSKRRSGIEGWFDEPSTGSIPVVDPDGTTSTVTVAPAPPRWKQAVSIWLGFFPVNLAFTYAMSPVPGWDAVPLWLRVLITTLVLTPIMTYWVLPFVTRSLRNWLAR